MKSIKYLSTVLLVSLSIIAFGSIEVVGSLKHINNSVRGSSYKGEIKITNSGADQQEVKVYQTDLLFNYEDFTYYNDPGSHDRSNASWIKFSPQTVIVQPNSSAYIQYEVTVPGADSIVGTYWSVLMIEGVNPIDPAQPGQFNINTITRYAVQIITEIDDPGKGLLEFMEPTLIREGDKLFLAVDIVNKGEHYISPDVTIELFDEDGNSEKIIEARKKGLFPYTSARYRFDLEGLKDETTYEAIIVAAGEGEDVYGLEYTLFF